MSFYLLCLEFSEPCPVVCSIFVFHYFYGFCFSSTFYSFCPMKKLLILISKFSFLSSVTNSTEGSAISLHIAVSKTAFNLLFFGWIQSFSTLILFFFSHSKKIFIIHLALFTFQHLLFSSAFQPSLFFLPGLVLFHKHHIVLQRV